MATKKVKETASLKKIDLRTRIKQSKWQLYLFMIVPTVLVLIFNYYPMLGIQLAFKKFDFNLGIWGSPWIGFDNFEKFFNSYMFARVLKNTLVVSFYTIIVGFPIPIIFALLMHAMTNLRYKKIVQTVTYLPHFISVVVVVGIIMQLLNPTMGAIASILREFGISEIPDVLSNPNAFSHLYVWSGIWQSMGWNSIIYFAALSGVDPTYYEAAEMDGATRLRKLISIDLPAILPTAVMLLIMNAGSVMNVGFEKAFLMQNDLNLTASEVISTYVYKVGMTGRSDFGYSTAIGLFNSVINFILIVTVNKISRSLSGNGLW